MIKTKSLFFLGGLYLGGLGAFTLGAPILSAISPVTHEARAEVLKVVNEAGSLQLMQKFQLMSFLTSSSSLALRQAKSQKESKLFFREQTSRRKPLP